MEENHIAAVEDLEAVYERKLNVECGNYLKLEQEKLEMRKHYEQRIQDLKRQNQRAIDKLLSEFKTNMVKVEGEYVDSQGTCKTLKDVYDRQLNRMEDNHEEEVVEVKQKHAEESQKLKEQYEKYLKEQQKIKEEKKRIEEERDRDRKEMEEAKLDKRSI